MSARPRQRCGLCGHSCRTLAGVCAACAYYLKTGNESPTYDLGLRGGRWVPAHGIKVWVQDGAA